MNKAWRQRKKIPNNLAPGFQLYFSSCHASTGAQMPIKHHFQDTVWDSQLLTSLQDLPSCCTRLARSATFTQLAQRRERNKASSANVHLSLSLFSLTCFIPFSTLRIFPSKLKNIIPIHWLMYKAGKQRKFSLKTKFPLKSLKHSLHSPSTLFPPTFPSHSTLSFPLWVSDSTFKKFPYHSAF